MFEISKESPIRAVKQETLDSLWFEAEGLGRIEIDSEWDGSAYQASISFKRESGTRIRAVGKHSDIHVALSKAINEAREMGA